MWRNARDEGDEELPKYMVGQILQTQTKPNQQHTGTFAKYTF